jgi:hypothetical protein
VREASGVRLADMVVEVEQVLPGTPEEVWSLLVDVERLGGLGPENVQNAWDGPERGVGAVFSGTNARGDRSWTVPCTVTVWEPGLRFGYDVGRPDQPSASWSYELAPVDGGTQVVQRFVHGPGPTFLRRAVEKDPASEEELVAGRAEDLAAGMRTVLRAVGDLLR